MNSYSDWQPDVQAQEGLMQVMNEYVYASFSTVRLFVQLYGKIPHCMEEGNVVAEKAIAWFQLHHGEEMAKQWHHHWNLRSKGKQLPYRYFVAQIFTDTLVELDAEDNYLKIYYADTPKEQVWALAKALIRFKRRPTPSKPEISLIVNNRNGLGTQSLSISPNKLALKENYNDDFQPVHHLILNSLRKANNKGLVLLHGKPGTGKTSYLRHLIGQLRKPVVFLPANLANSLTDPGFVNILTENANSVFVIEDAENIVLDRQITGSSAVSVLLNMADGLLADCLNIQLICTFNVDISRVDSALLRKGRLIASYEFKELTVEKAQTLSTKLGHKTAITQPMTLAALYNQDQPDFAPVQRAAVGFR